jgi:glucose-1-phosphate adenylyltransferase
MGGGQGSRLYPLTKERSKPAVPLAGKYRLVDIPISNCINSGLRKIYLLTQFNSASLHRHISQSYKFDPFTGGFVEILAAEQTPTDTSWYQGTADAVRKNCTHFKNNSFEHALILSGDQLYRIDFRELIRTHIEGDADLTVATIPVDREAARGFGIMHTDTEGRITRFVEKPQEDDLLDSLTIPRETYPDLGIESDSELFLASMGIYLFKREVLFELLDNNFTDFGKHIIPSAIESHKVYSSVYQGYWEDIGTIKSFFEANLDLVSDKPNFNFFDEHSPIFTRPRFLPASKLNSANLNHVVLSDGCIVTDSTVSHSILGVRTIIREGSRLNRTVVMGADYYDPDVLADGRVPLGIGRNCTIENAIIDKNARIGNNCTITPEGKSPHIDADSFYIRDGIVIIPKGVEIPDNTTI